MGLDTALARHGMVPKDCALAIADLLAEFFKKRELREAAAF